MKKKLILLLFVLTNLVSGQNKLVKDIDHDKKNDTVFIDTKTSKIICVLSTLNYKSVSSKSIEILNEHSGIKETKSGFVFYNDWMRAGYKNQFRYNSKTKKIQLIGMSRYEYGNAIGEGSGESSFNLLTGDYIGNWYYFDIAKDSLIKIPTIKSSIEFTPIYLSDFSDETYYSYADKCYDLFQKHKIIYMKTR
jgi:hypothetical protein